MDVLTSISTEKITSFWDLFFYPLLYVCGTWLIFWLLWKEKLTLFQKRLLRAYNNESGTLANGQAKSESSASKVVVVFIGLLVIYTYGKLFTLIGGLIPLYVNVDQSCLLLRLNTGDNSQTLPKLWSYYNNIDDINRFAKLVIHNVSVLSAQYNTSYYAIQYFSMREDVAFLTSTCLMLRMFIAITLLVFPFACADRAWNIFRRKFSIGAAQAVEVKHKDRRTKTKNGWIRTTLKIGKHPLKFFLTLGVLLFCLSFFSLNLMEMLCKQAQNRCEFLLTYLEANNEVPSPEVLEQATTKVLQAKDLMRSQPIGISESGMASIMWDACWCFHGMFPRLETVIVNQPLYEETECEEDTEIDDNANAGLNKQKDWGVESFSQEDTLESQESKEAENRTNTVLNEPPDWGLES